MGAGADRGLTQVLATDLVRDGWVDINRLGDEVAVKLSQSGGATAPAPASGGGTTSIHVTFPVPFPVVPNVLVSPNTTVPGNCAVGSAGASTTGFDLYCYRNSASATAVNWLAHVPGA